MIKYVYKYIQRNLKNQIFEKLVDQLARLPFNEVGLYF